MDAFEIRIRFVEVIRHLTSSQQSIQKLVRYAIRHGPRCSNDLWDCLVEEIEKANINARINIFYALDSLMEAAAQTGNTDYLNLVKRDLAKVVSLVVPQSKEGVLNLMSAKQILSSWRTRRVIDPDLVDKVMEDVLVQHTVESSDIVKTDKQGFTSFSRNDILRRIEDDRERHKRLREKIWVLPQPLAHQSASRPVTYNILTTSVTHSPHSPASPANGPQTQAIAEDIQIHPSSMLDPIDVEFDQLWEAEDALTEEDRQAMKRENERCFGVST